jgi:hypothetical protein
MGASRGKAGVAGLVTQGYGGLFRFVKEQARRIVRVGKSSAKRAAEGLEEIVVWAKLVRVNDRKPDQNIEGFIRVGIDKARHIAVSLMGMITSKVRNTWNDIKVTISRIK